MTWGQFCEAYGRRVGGRAVRGHYEATLRLVAAFGELADMAGLTDGYVARFASWAVSNGVPRGSVVAFVKRLWHMRRTALATYGGR